MDGNRWLVALAVAGIVMGAVMRVLWPEADPPTHRQTGATWWDEYIAHDARNIALWGEAHQDAWRPAIVAPLYTAVTASSLRAFGVSYLTLRLPALAAGLLLIALTALAAHRAGFGRHGALLAAFLTATAWPLAGFGRVALMDSLMLPVWWASLTMLIVAEGARGGRLAWYAAAGVVAALAVFAKYTAVLLLTPAVLFVLVGPSLEAGRIAWRRTAAFAAGGLVTGAACAAVWVVPHGNTFFAYLFEAELTDESPHPFALAIRAVQFFDSQTFAGAPFLFALAAVMMPAVYAAARKPAEEGPGHVRRFALGLVLSVVVMGAAATWLTEVFARRTLWLAPCAALLLAAWEGGALAREPAPRWMRAAAALVAGLVLSAWLVSPNGGVVALAEPELAAWLVFTMRAKLVAKGAFVLVGVLLAAAAYRHWSAIQRAVFVNRRHVAGALVCLQAAWFAYAAGGWAWSRSYTVRAASERIAEVSEPGDYVLGQWAVTVAFANRTRPLVWSPGSPYANHDLPRVMEQFAPSYLLLTEVQHAWVAANADGEVERYLHQRPLRLPMFEVHESPALRGDLLLFPRGAAVSPGG